MTLKNNPNWNSIIKDYNRKQKEEKEKLALRKNARYECDNPRCKEIHNRHVRHPNGSIVPAKVCQKCLDKYKRDVKELRKRT